MPAQYTIEYNGTQLTLNDFRLRLRENGYRPIPAEGKVPALKSWQKVEADADAIRKWSKTHRTAINTGIVCGDVIGIDIDILDYALVHKIESLAYQMLGPTPLHRDGQLPKTLLVYRTEKPFKKLKISFSKPDAPAAAVEALASGQQFIAFGIHPDTHRPYTWGEQTPLDTPCDDLPVIDVDMVRAFLEAAEPVLLAAGYQPVGARKQQPKPLEHFEIDDGDVFISDVEYAVGLIPNDDVHWDEWNRGGMAIYAATAGSEDGFRIFDQWSRKSKKYDADGTLEKWRAYRRSPPTSISVGTLYHLANEIDPDWRQKADKKFDEEIMAWQRATAEAPFEYFLPPGTPVMHFDRFDKANHYKMFPCGSAEEAEFLEDQKRLEQQCDFDQQKQQQQGSDQDQHQRRSDKRVKWYGEASADSAIDWLVKGLLKKQTVALLSGQWGMLKSTMALNLAGSIVTDTPFFDYLIKEKTGVLYVAVEGASTIGLRAKAMIASKLNTSVDDTPKLPLAWVDLQPRLTIDGPGSLVAIAKGVDADMQREFGCRLGMIVIDTLIAAGAIQDENDAAKIQIVMNHLWTLANEIGAAVIAVDHMGKDPSTGTRGSSAKEAAADLVVICTGERTLDGNLSKLAFGVRKNRDGEAGRSLPFRREIVDMGVDEDGELLTTVVIHPDPGRERQDAAGKASKGQLAVERALAMALDRGGKVINIESGPVKVAETALVRATFIAAQGDKGSDAARKRWERGLDDAIKAGRIRRLAVEEVEYLAAGV